MKTRFKDILGIPDVLGVVFLSPNGDVAFKQFQPSSGPEVDIQSWHSALAALSTVQEADLVFENNRLYLRKTPTGTLMVLMSRFGPAAMVRMHSDLFIASLPKEQASKGLKRFFKWKK